MFKLKLHTTIKTDDGVEQRPERVFDIAGAFRIPVEYVEQGALWTHIHIHDGQRWIHVLTLDLRGEIK